MSAIEEDVLKDLPRRRGREATATTSDDQLDFAVEDVKETWIAAATAHSKYLKAYSTSAIDESYGHSGSELSSESPFDVLLDTKLRVARRIISEAINSGAIDRRLYERLDGLVELAADEYPDTDIPSALSIRTTIKFFALGCRLRLPYFALLSNGNVWAEWIKKEDAARVAIQFRKNGSVSIAATFPDSAEPLRQSSQMFGSLSSKAAITRLQNIEEFAWLWQSASQ